MSLNSFREFIKNKNNENFNFSGHRENACNFGKSSIYKKQRSSEKVKMVFDKIAAEGLSSTIDAVRSKLSSTIPLEYSNVGIVEELNGSISDIKIGDRLFLMVSCRYSCCKKKPSQSP